MIAMTRITSIILTLLAVVSLFPAALQAQNNPIYFPYVVNDSQTSTDLILTNLGDSDATVLLTGYQETGAVESEVTVQVRAASQAIVSGGSLSRSGWVRGSSDVAGVRGNIQLTSTDGNAQETTGPAEPDST